jgi:hypothetical protein
MTKENKKYCLDVTYNVVSVEGCQVFREYFASKEDMEKFKRLMDEGRDQSTTLMLINESIHIVDEFEVTDIELSHYEEVSKDEY